MHTAIGVVWFFIQFLNWTSLAVMLLAVIIFGRNLLKAAGRDRQSDVLSPLIWKGPKAKLALKVFCVGAALQALSILIALVVPGRT
jgi:hypothetical protein